MSVIITMYRNESCLPVVEWVCEDDAILDILGEQTYLERYHVLSDGFRLLVELKDGL